MYLYYEVGLVYTYYYHEVGLVYTYYYHEVGHILIIIMRSVFTL